MGSVALLPRGMLHWRVSSPSSPHAAAIYTVCVCVKVNDVEELTPESFTLFHLIEPQIGKRPRGNCVGLDLFSQIF